MKYWCTALFCCLLCCPSLAQQLVRVQAETGIPRGWRGPHQVGKDSARATTILRDLHHAMLSAGHLEASVDTCTAHGDTLDCRFHVGPVYRWARLAPGNLPQEVASAAGFRGKLYQGRPVTPRQTARLLQRLLVHAENNGHPFAQVGLDSLHYGADGLAAALRMELGPAVVFDSVIVRGSARVNPRYLHAYIGIRPGDRYTESLVRALPDRLRELPFVSVREAPFVAFGEPSTKLFLFLDDRKASSFNGVLGLQPDALTGAVRLTGDLDLKLRNALRRGEAIELNWRSLQDRTQDLRTRFNLPLLFNSPFGIDLGLKLFKRDTSFLEVNSRVAVEYLLDHGDKLQLFLNNRSSKRLGRLLLPMPGMADVRITSYGLGFQRERFDYRFNPRSGLGMVVEGSVGRKRSETTLLSDTARSVGFAPQADVNAKIVWHIPLRKRSTLRFSVQGGGLINDALHTNELYRIGGLQTMRGMNEASLYVSSYAIGTFEYRFLFEENSNFFVFVDQGWWENTANGRNDHDTPLGLGLGTNFETKAGIFSLTYALGRQFNAPIALRAGKVHFGFTSLF